MGGLVVASDWDVLWLESRSLTMLESVGLGGNVMDIDRQPRAEIWSNGRLIGHVIRNPYNQEPLIVWLDKQPCKRCGHE